MYYFTGSNIFGQWLGCSGNIIEKFTSFPEKLQSNNTHFDVKCADLVHIGWSHNIFHFNNEFYVVGDYKTSGHYLEVVSLPNDCSNTSNVLIISDDYRLVLVYKDTYTLQLLGTDNKNCMKTIKVNTEIPVECEPKRCKKEVTILKCVAAYGSLMFLNSDGLVYSGLLPSLVDTGHCIGKPLDIQCGYEHFMLLTDGGRVYTWGNGRRLQLGQGDVCSIDTPTEVEALAGIKIIKIAAGGWHSMALSEFQDLYVWGWNDTGQLGIKENSNKEPLISYSLPTVVDLFDDNGCNVNKNIKDLACGTRHSAILLEDNTIWTTGNNKYGQLGLSVESNPTVNYFRKVWSVTFDTRLMCGQWSTVVSKR